MRGFLIAGTASGVGKTTVTLALIAAMRRQGLVVQSFKGGPDFLDTGHHSRIAGRTARNLDTWMLPISANGDVVRDATRGADIVIVEGMMGLFDGKDGASEHGSSAEIAKLFQLPVVLVIDAAKSARSIAAVVLGFEQFDPQISLAGVILNRVAGERHYKMLETAIISSCRTPVLGWLMRNTDITIPERHLGLQTADEFSDSKDVEGQIDVLASLAENHLNLSTLTSLQCGFDFESTSSARIQVDQPPVRIGVARDRAFSFYYEDNLDLLRQHGAEIVSFSPLDDDALPESLDALYLGGGYPELYAPQLNANQSMFHSIRMFAASDRPIYAECGGMIYLSRRLKTLDGEIHELADVLPLSIEMTNALVKFGYVTVELTRDCLLGPRGTFLRGHSFHYSRITGVQDMTTSYRANYSISSRQEDEGFGHGNILASYIHLHFHAAPHIAQHFIELVRSVRSKDLMTV